MCNDICALRIGDLTADKPIIQGGMGVGVSLSGLASAVANQGGIGVISSVGIGFQEPDFLSNHREANKRALRKEIHLARRKTSGILGVNIMVALSDFADLVKVAIEEEVDILFIGAGLPLKIPQGLSLDYLRQSRTKVIPIVSSARAARVIFRYWQNNFGRVPDGVVVEGPMAGGHLGYRKEDIFNPAFSLERILPAVCKEIALFEKRFTKEIPVIAAGGIFTGEDMYNSIKQGAQGVQMGTRFVATDECDASQEFKDQYVNCRQEDITIIDSPVGMPGRAIENTFILDAQRGKKKPFKCRWKCLKTCNFKRVSYCIADALTNAQKGHFEGGFAFSGANAHRVNSIVPVRELMNSLMQEMNEAFCYSLADKPPLCRVH